MIETPYEHDVIEYINLFLLFDVQIAFEHLSINTHGEIGSSLIHMKNT